MMAEQINMILLGFLVFLVYLTIAIILFKEPILKWLKKLS